MQDKYQAELTTNYVCSIPEDIKRRVDLKTFLRAGQILTNQVPTININVSDATEQNKELELLKAELASNRLGFSRKSQVAVCVRESKACCSVLLVGKDFRYSPESNTVSSYSCHDISCYCLREPSIRMILLRCTCLMLPCTKYLLKYMYQICSFAQHPKIQQK